MTEQNDPRLSLDSSQPPVRYSGVVHGMPLADPLGGEGATMNARHLKDYFRVLYRRRWPMVFVFAGTLVATIVYTYTRVPLYEAKAKLLIESDDPMYVNFRGVLDQNQSGAPDYYQTQYDLLKSRSLARRTLQALEMWPADAAPVGSTADTTAAEGRSAPVSRMSFIKRIVWALYPGGPPDVVAPSESRDESAAQTSAINGLLGGLIVTPVKNSRVVDVRYHAIDPDFATRVANAHARSFIEQNMEYKFMASKEATDWLASRLGEQRKQLEQAEGALQRYRETNDAMAADERENIVIQKLSDMSREVTQARTTRLQKEAVYNQLRGLEKNPGALDSFPAILFNAVIQGQQAELARLQRERLEQSQTFRDTHPEMESLSKTIEAAELRLRAEIAKVVQGVRNDYLSAVAQEQSLSQGMEEQKVEALAMNRKAIEYGVLRREVESARTVYQSLLNRSEETGVSEKLRTSNVRVVDLAERPRSPIYPATESNMIRGVVGALAFALCIGFFFDYMDNRVKTPDEIREHLRIAPLGLIPLVREAKAHAEVIDQRRDARFLEALRTLRTNVVFSCPDAESRSIVVTSSGPGEGKTVCSSNLAISLAEAGLRVLVIDGDMRKPKLHAAFGIAQDPGLSNLIVGTAKASETVAKTSTTGLWALPAGRTPPNPAELLGSSRFRDFLASLQSHFDWIIIDTPPVMAVADAAVISHIASGVVFVIGADMVSRQTAAAALDQLENANARILGGVLNRVDFDRQGYYYSQYYRKEYSDYYIRTA